MSPEQVRLTLEDGFECASCQEQLDQSVQVPMLMLRKCGHYEVLCQSCVDMMVSSSARMLLAEEGAFAN